MNPFVHFSFLEDDENPVATITIFSCYHGNALHTTALKSLSISRKY